MKKIQLSYDIHIYIPATFDLQQPSLSPRKCDTVPYSSKLNQTPVSCNQSSFNPILRFIAHFPRGKICRCLTLLLLLSHHLSYLTYQLTFNRQWPRRDPDLAPPQWVRTLLPRRSSMSASRPNPPSHAHPIIPPRLQATIHAQTGKHTLHFSISLSFNWLSSLYFSRSMPYVLVHIKPPFTSTDR